MTIVELVDAHEGFSLITRYVRSKSKVSLLWVIGICTFFLSSVLDNLTTTIVMISVLRKLVADAQLRLLYVGIVVIAANAGGAWTVIGDVTTTMIWMKHKIGEWEWMRDLFLPSVACLLVPLGILSMQLKGELEYPKETEADKEERSNETWHKALFLFL